jgi:Protein of unknown function (DUF3810)
MTRRHGWRVVYALAIAAALAPLPRGMVERWYSQAAYPAIQHTLTPLSNRVPFAIFDAICLAAIAALGVTAWRARRETRWRATLRVLRAIARGAAVMYLAFLATWGLNYRRVPLTDKLAFDASRVTDEAASVLALRTVESLNRLYLRAHARPTSLSALAASFDDAHRALGSREAVVPGRPKQTLLGGYFHYASIAGMTDPFFLETLIAPDLLDVERPFVIAHEWGHLAGYADESEANYLAWLTCLRGDERAQYSAWLALLGDLQPFVPKGARLDGGPRSDLFALRFRYARTSPVLRAAARESYDRYLKANRVERGIESYDAVVQLILGTEVGADGNPKIK